MSFDNRYPHRKDWRREYRDSKRFDLSCRPHGGCPWCEANRRHHDRKELARAEATQREWQEAGFVVYDEASDLTVRDFARLIYGDR